MILLVIKLIVFDFDPNLVGDQLLLPDVLLWSNLVLVGECDVERTSF